VAMGMEDLFELEAPVSAPRSSVPFRGRLFAFVLQTGRLLFFTCVAPPPALHMQHSPPFFFHQRAIG